MRCAVVKASTNVETKRFLMAKTSMVVLDHSRTLMMFNFAAKPPYVAGCA